MSDNEMPSLLPGYSALVRRMTIGGEPDWSATVRRPAWYVRLWRWVMS